MRRALFWIRACAGGTGFGIAVAWFGVLRLVPVSNAYRRQSFARVMARLCCPPLGVRVRVVGGERVGQYHPCIYVSNHQSQIDYPIAGTIFPGNAIIMARQVGDWPVLGPFFRSAGNIALDRDVPVRAVAALSEAEKAILDRHLSVWMFAEGTRSKQVGQIGRFKRGAFRLAAVTGAPIIPIVISPLKPHTDLRGRRLSPHDVVVHVLEPVFARSPARADEEALREDVKARMQAVLG